MNTSKEKGMAQNGLDAYMNYVKDGCSLPNGFEAWEIIEKVGANHTKDIHKWIEAVHLAIRAGIGIGYLEGKKKAR